MEHQSISIQIANSEDAALLADLSRTSFDQAFSGHPANAPEDMRLYMDSAFSMATISQELTDPQNIFLLALVDGKIAGYAKIRTESTEEGITASNPIELCRLYALGEYIGRGIGSALMSKCFEIGRQRGHDVMWLGVWEYNHRAQKFYARYGFKKVGEHVFLLGSDPQTDWVMQLTL